MRSKRVDSSEQAPSGIDSPYRREVEIDKDRLDDEWVEQPERYLKYSELCSAARDRMDRTAALLDVAKAEAAQDIRSKPERFGKQDKNGNWTITEGAVSEAVVLHPSVASANGKWLEARHEWDVLMGVVRAFEQRKDALENLVRLHLAGYFAAPTVQTDDAGKARQFREDTAMAPARRIRAAKDA